MTSPRNALVLASALLATMPASAALDVHDTLVSDVLWTSIGNSSTKPAKGGKSDPSNVRIDKERGVARARLTLAGDAPWTFWDGNPFARHGRGVVSLGLPTRVLSKSVLLPRESAIATKLRSSEPVRKPVATAPAKAAAPVASVAPIPLRDTAPAIQESTRTVPVPRPDTSERAPSDTSTPSPRSIPSDTQAAPAAASRATATNSATSEIKGEDGVFTVVLDAGHGGKDPGAVGKKVDDKALMEKDAALGIALKLREELRSYKDIRVVMTRDNDEFLKLGERTKIANAKKGDLFISIHCNSLPLNSSRRDEVEGFMVYLLREAKSDADRAIERRENEVIRYETGERQRKEALSPVEWVMLEHQLNLYTKESERFAGLVVRNMEAKSPVRKERTGAGQAGFFVLVGALMPSVLVETGYVSNDDDARNLGSEAGRRAIARQIARSIDEFRRGVH